MVKNAQNVTALLARLLLAAIFINSAYGKITGWSGTIAYMSSQGLPAPQTLLPLAIVAEALGGLSLILGFKPRLGALALIAFLIPTTFIFHDFWTYPADQQHVQMIQFMKNLAILGGLGMVLAHGAGQWALSRRRPARKPPVK